MPMTNPVIIKATWRYFSPNTCMRPEEMRWAAPVSATSLPNMEPAITTMASEPSISPTPFCTLPPIRPGSIPRSNPAVIETKRKERNALTLKYEIRTINKAMHARTIRMDIESGSCKALELVRYLDDADQQLMRIAILVNKIELDSRVVPLKVALDIDNLVILE